ncbi:MAG: glycosyltransferase family 9 protein, partial [Thermodesulfovibrio sp.]|nr:glycosyltransferase family 9 protein [Thermodesulfovibrio sp.]
IRRDNIGDLICTTPAIHAVRQAYPRAKIGILVNTYNAEAIMNNSDIDEIYIYEKAKHVPEKNKLSVWLNNLKVLMKIRKEKYDVALACGSYSPRLARYTYMTGAKMRIGYLPENIQKSIFYNLYLKEPKKPMHEVERVFRLLSFIGIEGKPDKMKIYPSSEKIQKVRQLLINSRFSVKSQNDKISQNNIILIAFHISSRKPENRWAPEKFVRLASLILKKYHNVSIMLLWSPGSEKNPYHPGDDEKAEYIIKAVPNIIPVRTVHLSELIAALSLANLVVCLDGGAMHIAAALGKPIVTIWGSTDPSRWKPWGVKHIIVQHNKKNTEYIDVELVWQAIEKMLYEAIDL